MSIGFNLPVTSQRTSSSQAGLRSIGQILPDVLANYAQRASSVAAEGSGNRPYTGGRIAPRVPADASRSVWPLSGAGLQLAASAG